MFLSRSSLIKAVMIGSFLLLFGVIFFVIAYFVGKGDINPTPSLTVGVISVCLAVLSVIVGIYADGVSKPFAEATRLVKKDLLPKRFIEIYKEKCESGDYVIARPRFDTLELLYTAYDLLDDKRGRASVIAEMKEKMKPSYKGRIAVYAADEAYRKGDIEEGDRLLTYAEKHDGSSTVAAMADAVRKTSGAASKGEPETVEKYYGGLLSASGIFKADNAAALTAHWRLYNISKNKGKEDEAKEHLTYCAENGGHTAISKAAKSLL